jgi:hypothetical protein
MPETMTIPLLHIHMCKKDSLPHESAKDAPRHPLVPRPRLSRSQFPSLIELDRENPCLYLLPDPEQNPRITSQLNPASGSTENSAPLLKESQTVKKATTFRSKPVSSIVITRRRSTYLVCCPREPLKSYEISSSTARTDTRQGQVKNLSTNFTSETSEKSPPAR